MSVLLEEEPLGLEKWKPQGFLSWALATCAVFLIAHAVFKFGSFAYEDFTTDNSPMAIVYDYQPKELSVAQGDEVVINYLYTRRACSATVNYKLQKRYEGAIVSNYNVGPFQAGWPSTNEPRWIAQSLPLQITSQEPGKYDLFWQVSGRCQNENGEKRSANIIYSKSPVTKLEILANES